MQLFTLLPLDGFKIFLVVFLSFLIGLEREETKTASGRYVFGGVRTYPLIGLVGYSMAYLSDEQRLPLAAGFIVVGIFLMLSYWHKLTTSENSGLTSEIAGLATYLIGALIYYGHFWVATALGVTSLILLELKAALEGLAQRFSSADTLTFTQFLFLTIVILPILPNQRFAPVDINPFQTWLVVVAVSTISYGSFLLQRVIHDRDSVTLIALLGGAYSSTATTVALAKRSALVPRRHLYAGSILMASGVMYLRLAILISLFNQELRQTLLVPLGSLGSLGVISGWIWSRRASSPGPTANQEQAAMLPQNPLELKAALLFALLFVVIVAVTHYTTAYLGTQSVYALAGIMGITDVDPFILGLTQLAGRSTPLTTASSAILIATASNNVVKGVYALVFGDRATGWQSLMLLTIFASLGLIPLLWTLS